ncbi:MAG TPA: arabinan endo-1,5-alpha-L-arabinosidase, partial [Polyangiales bacterium]|nr:arabinan endo-1,5-alpha-L-arabinosidase [Polyangiales bacterium]
AGTPGMSVAGGAAGAAAGSGGSAGAAGMAGTAGASGEDCAADTDPPQVVNLTGNLGTHDPVMIQADGRYYLFHTGRGIPTKTSNDMKSWAAGPAVFSSSPAWIAQRVSGATDLWAPDISFWGGSYHLYYSASTFGSNHSCIGHATRAKLNEGNWMDQGPVICSNDGSNDNWNAIDPNVIVDEKGAAFLAFGSFWSGIKMIPLDASGKRQGTELIALAARSGNSTAIEAPYIVRRCNQYYLFVSWDTCCKGADSTYKIAVGRATSVRGPYMARDGTAMMRGGGTLLLQGAGSWKGPGHNAVIHTDDGWFNVYHAYAASDGHSQLRISQLAWDVDGWPTSAGP